MEGYIKRPSRWRYVLVAAVFFLVGFSFDSLLNQVVKKRSAEQQISSGLPNDLNYSSVEEFYDLLRVKYDGELSEEQLIDGLKRGLAEATGDPYTVYFNEEEAQSFKDELNGTFSGIGAELGEKNGLIVIVAPIAGYPAEQAGLRAGDAILTIDGTETVGMTIDEAVTKIRGEEGTNVTLKVLRGNEQLEFTITRAAITVPSVKSEILANNVGYIQISRFADDTADLAREAAEEFKAKGVTGVVVDLRNNTGGYLQSAVDVASIWLNGEVVVEQKRGGQTEDTLKAGRSPVLNGVPTTVLINEGSASASEILAGALQDYQVATLVGATSYGKGSVQALEELPGGGVLKVTIARWFTPNGRGIDKEGIKPDVEVELTDEDFDNDRDPQKDAAINEILN